jgi:hypothetical protein
LIAVASGSMTMVLFIFQGVLVLSFFMVPYAGAQEIVYVDASAAGSNDGTSWTNAYTDLQDALVASESEVWVVTGTYTPTAPNGDRAATFQLRDGLSVYGGFAGGEATRGERDPSTNVTVLSGDLNGDDGGGTGVNARWYNMGENSYHVVKTDGVTALLDGFTITRGWSWQASGTNSAGAGLFIENSSLTLANCTVTLNMAHLGAGLYNANSPSTVSDCAFIDNYVPDGRGGAIYHSGDYDNPGVSVMLTIRGTQFLNNVATPGGGPGDAGAIWSSFDAPVDISGCLFEGNEARWRFTNGNFAAGGGAMLIFGAGSVIQDTVFRGNRAHVGGALWIGRDTTIVNCLFVANEAFRQSVGFNEYGGYAGAIYCPSTFNTTLIANSTFHANAAPNVGGIWAGDGTTIANSILWTNTSTEVEATLLDQQLSGTPALFNNCIKGLLTQEPGEDAPDPTNFPGAIVVAPMFIDADGTDGVAGTADDDLRLGSGSPCIDAADNSYVPVGAATDFDGNVRFFDDPGTPDAGTGAAPLADVGAYEFGPWVDYGTNALPTASFTYAIEGDTVTFADTSSDSDGTLVEWVWAFGDATSSADQHPVHGYRANGDYAVVLRVRDDANGTARSIPLTITIAGYAPPPLTITAPLAGSTLANMAIIEIESSDMGNIDEVKYYVDDEFIGKGKDAPFSFAWDSTTVNNGPHTLTAKSVDFSEETTWSAPVVILVDNSTPVFVSDPGLPTINVGDVYRYNVIATGDPAPAFSLDVRPDGMAIDPATGLLTWTPGPGQLGLQNISVRAANSVGFDVQSFIIEAVDTAAPSAPTGLAATNITASTAVLVWDEATDNVGVASYQVWKYIKINRFPGHWRAIIENITGTSVEVSVPSGSRYSHQFLVKAIDAAGNLSLSSNSITVAPLSGPRPHGDVNSDGDTDAADIQTVINSVLGTNEVTPLEDADVNGDEVVNALDIQVVINAVLGIDAAFPLP